MVMTAATMMFMVMMPAPSTDSDDNNDVDDVGDDGVGDNHLHYSQRRHHCHYHHKAPSPLN